LDHFKDHGQGTRKKMRGEGTVLEPISEREEKEGTGGARQREGGTLGERKVYMQRQLSGPKRECPRRKKKPLTTPRYLRKWEKKPAGPKLLSNPKKRTAERRGPHVSQRETSTLKIKLG